MINIAICDDEAYITLEVERLLLSIAESNGIRISVEVYCDGSTLQKAIDNGEDYDLIYLDIEMKQDGIITAQSLRKQGVKALIIYISSHDKYLRRLFEVDAMRFLDKPINKEVFAQYFLIAVNQINQNEELFAYSYNRMTYKIAVKNIIYFESGLRILYIHQVDGSTSEYYGSLREVERYFEDIKIPFLRPHQSFLVNYQHIHGCGKKGLELKDGTYIPISESRKEGIAMRYGILIRKDIFNE